jgi:hypothetical protein
MKNQNSLVMMLVALMATSSIADANESLTDRHDGFDAPIASADGGEAITGNKAKGKTIADTEEDAAFLEEMTAESAAQAGVAGDYEEYSDQLAKTLARLTPAQQARIFN